MLKLIGIVLAIGGAQAGHAADWRLAAESDRAVSYLDLGSIVKTGDDVRFARWLVLRTAMASGADSIKDSFAAMCSTKAYRVLSATASAGQREIGRMPASAGKAEPGTVTASLIEIACGARMAPGGAVADPYAAGKERLKPAPAG